MVLTGLSQARHLARPRAPQQEGAGPCRKPVSGPFHPAL